MHQNEKTLWILNSDCTCELICAFFQKQNMHHPWCNHWLHISTIRSSPCVQFRPKVKALFPHQGLQKTKHQELQGRNHWFYISHHLSEQRRKILNMYLKEMSEAASPRLTRSSEAPRPDDDMFNRVIELGNVVSAKIWKSASTISIFFNFFKWRRSKAFPSPAIDNISMNIYISGKYECVPLYLAGI